MGYCFPFGCYIKITEVAHILEATLLSSVVYASIYTKMGWAKFWANFSQTHLVTLLAGEVKRTRFAIWVSFFATRFSDTIRGVFGSQDIAQRVHTINSCHHDTYVIIFSCYRF
jgi:hypothetical protein